MGYFEAKVYLKAISFRTYTSNKEQVWHWPYEAPGIVDSGLYAITTVCGPKDTSLKNLFLFHKKYKHHGCYYQFLYRVEGTVYLS